MPADDDSALLAELLAGSASALHSLYLKYQSRILSYLARLSGSLETAQDLSSEVWCRAAGKLHTLRPDSRLLPWLFTIARNLYFSHCRWRSRDEHYLNELGVLHVLGDRPPGPAEAALRSEREAALEAALARLPRIYREAVILAGIEGLAAAEAAQVSGISPEAFRQRLARGLKMLRAGLAGGGEDA